jgi:hypothetical protein
VSLSTGAPASVDTIVFNSINGFVNSGPTDRTLLVSKCYDNLPDRVVTSATGSKKAQVRCVDQFGTKFVYELWNADLDDCLGHPDSNPFKKDAVVFLNMNRALLRPLSRTWPTDVVLMDAGYADKVIVKPYHSPNDQRDANGIFLRHTVHWRFQTRTQPFDAWKFKDSFLKFGDPRNYVLSDAEGENFISDVDVIPDGF